MVSFNEMEDVSQLGNKTNGISIAATVDGKLLLLKEFRMAVGRTVFNLCAGMMESGETVEACIKRELYEEVGLTVRHIKKIN